MSKDYFKRLTVTRYTSWELNCRSIVPHNKARNRIEKRIKRYARRKDKEFLKKILDSFEGM